VRSSTPARVSACSAGPEGKNAMLEDATPAPHSQFFAKLCSSRRAKRETEGDGEGEGEGETAVRDAGGVR
jgi:hypothetical protein